MAIQKVSATRDERFHSTSAEAPWYRERFVWLLIAIPGASVIGGIAMLILALSSHDGLVADDYYRRGMEINLELKRDRAALEKQITGILDINTDKSLVLNLNHKSNRAPEQLELRLLHATRDGYDRVLLLPRGHDGNYRGALLNLAPGKYHAQIVTAEWRISGILLYPASARIQLKAAVL